MPGGAQPRRHLPRWVVVLAVLAVCSASIYLAGVSETHRATGALQRTVFAQCERSNAIRAGLRIALGVRWRPGLYQILDCAPTTRGRVAVVLPDVEQTRFVVEVQACLDVPAGRPSSAWCVGLTNGPLRAR